MSTSGARDNMVLTDGLQESWTEFCKDQQVQRGYFSLKDGAFSLILGALGEKFLEVCKACGFSETQFDQLRLLLVKLEQQCLLSIFIAFQSYRSDPANKQTNSISRIEEMHSVVKPDEFPFSSDTKEFIPDALSDSIKYAEASNNKEIEIKKKKVVCGVTKARKQLRVSLWKFDDPTLMNKRSIANQETFALEDSELGRGKRKKFAKLHFDVLQDRQPPNLAIQDDVLRAKDSELRETASQEPETKGDKSEVNVCKKAKLSVSGGHLTSESEKETLEESRPDKGEKETVPTKCSNHSIANETSTVNTDTTVVYTKGNSLKKKSKNSSVIVKSNCEEVTEEDSMFLSENDEPRIGDKEKVKAEMAGERTDFDCDDLAPIICSICKQKLTKSRDLVRHWKAVHVEEHGKPSTPFYCDVCQESFDAPRRFKLHYRIHSGARPHVCQVCGKTFRIFKGLKDHMMCHTKERPFACPQCPKRFINKKLLTYHIKVHNNEIVPRVCELCGKQYQTSLGLKLHYRVHAGVRPHKCDVCGMAFTQRCSLQIHKRLHTGDKRHICDVCGWRFNTNNALMTHKRVHTGERPYKCSQCPFQAASSSCLRDHEIVHTSAKPFQCHAAGCNKHFKRQAHLMTHLKKKHSGLKPYVCTLCDVKFAMVSELLLHQKSDACDGGRIKREATPEPDPVPDPVQASSKPLPNPSIHLPDNAIQNHNILVFESQEDMSELDSPKIFGKKKSTVLDSQAQELQISHASDLMASEDNQIVIHIVSEPGMESSDVVLSEEEMAAIVRLSQQM